MSLTPEQLKLRMQGIGGSEIAAIAGLNPYATALDVYRAKVEGYVFETTSHMERGIFLEEGYARWYAHRTGSTLRETGTLRHPTFSRVLCTPDRLATTSSGAELDVSIKAPGRFAQAQWGEPGTDEIPDAYNCQVQWELLVLEPLNGIRVAHVVAPIEDDLGIYTVAADPELQGYLLELAQRFWRDHVETKTPPPVDGTESSTRWLAARYPTHQTPLMIATQEGEQLIARFAKARIAREKAELEEETAKNALKALIGEAEGMKGTNGCITWKAAKGSLKTDWEALAKELNPSEDLVQKHSRITQGSRRFLFKESK